MEEAKYPLETQTVDLKRNRTSEGKNLTRDWLPIKHLPIKKTPDPDDFTVEVPQILKRILDTQSFPNSSKIKEEAILPNSFYLANITLIPRQTKISEEKKTIDQHPLWIWMKES